MFICHGNICRSPMAEFVMKDLAAKAGISARFEIASAATSAEEIGKPIRTQPYPLRALDARRDFFVQVLSEMEKPWYTVLKII